MSMVAFENPEFEGKMYPVEFEIKDRTESKILLHT